MPDLTELREAHRAAMTEAEVIEENARAIAYHLQRGQYADTTEHHEAIDKASNVLSDNLGYLREHTREEKPC